LRPETLLEDRAADLLGHAGVHGGLVDDDGAPFQSSAADGLADALHDRA
jgi:hypothetical protein